MHQQDLQAMQKAGITIPTDAPRAILLCSAAAIIERVGTSSFKSLRNVEGKLAALRATPVAGTVVEPIVEALKAGGVPMPESATVGDMMDRIGLEQHEVDKKLCHCTNGDTITGTQLAKNLRGLADQQ